MLELARIDLAETPGVRRAMRNPALMHRLLMGAFAPDVGGRLGAGLLYRVEDERRILAQYAAPAVWAKLGQDMKGSETRGAGQAHEALRPGMQLRFLLHANATFDGVVDGRRRRTAIRDAARQVGWLQRKLVDAGAEPALDNGRLALSVGQTWSQRGLRGDQAIVHQGVVFAGVLVVLDADQLRVALRAGVGRGRAYGFGLLTVAR